MGATHAGQRSVVAGVLPPASPDAAERVGIALQTTVWSVVGSYGELGLSRVCGWWSWTKWSPESTSATRFAAAVVRPSMKTELRSTRGGDGECIVLLWVR